MARVEGNRRKWAIAGLVLGALATVVAISMTAPSAASAQGLPSICDEYPNLPVCDPEPPVPPGGEEGGPTAEDQGVDKGELPFTGYPMTPLLLLLLLLLLLGVAIRAYLEMRDRVRARGGGDGPLGLV